MPRTDVGIQLLEKSFGSAKIPKLKRLGFTLNYACDGDCSYCFNKPDWQENKKLLHEEISLAEFKEILKQAIPLGLEEVQLSGGEPLMKRDILNFVREAKHAGIRVGIFTNGALLDKNMIENLKTAGLDWVRVGLGGSTAETSRQSGRLNDTKKRFETILKNIRASVDAGFTTGVFTPVTKNNFLDIHATAALAGKLGTKYIIFCNYIALGNEQDKVNRMNIQEHYRAIEEFLKAREEQRSKIEVLAYYGFFEYLSPNWNDADAVLKGPCGRERLAFIANGDIRTCLCTTHKIGSFREKFNLKKLWELHPFLIEIRKDKQFEPCLHCRRKNICRPCLTPTISLSKCIDCAPPNCPAVAEFRLLEKEMPEKEAMKKALRKNFIES